MRIGRVVATTRAQPAHAVRAARWPAYATALVVPVVLAVAIGPNGHNSGTVAAAASGAPRVVAPADDTGSTDPLGTFSTLGSSAALGPLRGSISSTSVWTPPASSISTSAAFAAATSAAPAPVSALADDGIPTTALDAYRRAAASVATTDPSCGLPWPLLAGIGRVESDHGRFAGAVLHSDGTSSQKILGIALDGTRSAVVRDTDNGRLDGDTVFDRAVGPMQFIPSTWATWGADGNGDGVIDPFNIYDAALAAAHYLCAAGGDLRTLAGQTRAVLAYNHSTAYLTTVLGLESTYAAGVPGLTVPVLPTPAPPKHATPPPIPPVDPGRPIGLPADPPSKTGAPSHPAPPTHRPAPPTVANPAASGTSSVPPSSAAPSSAAPSSAPPSSAPPSSAPPSSAAPSCTPPAPTPTPATSSAAAAAAASDPAAAAASDPAAAAASDPAAAAATDPAAAAATGTASPAATDPPTSPTSPPDTCAPTP